MQDTKNDNPTPEGDQTFPEHDTMESLPGSMKPKIPEVDRPVTPPDTLEKQESQPEGPSEVFSIPEAAPVEPEVVESKTRRFFRRLIRWAAGLLIVFGLGFLTAVFVLYRPATQEAERNTEILALELTDQDENITALQNQITDLETQITNLQPYKEKNDELLLEQQDLKLHIAILDARVDVANATISLSKGNDAQVRVILAKTSETLDTIKNLLEADQQAVASSLQERLGLVLGEVDNDPFAAGSDLDVLETKLLQLQDSLFSE